MATVDFFRVHEAARIRSGKWAGLVGTVTAERTEGDKQTSVRVHIEGVKDSEPVNVTLWFKRSAVERNQHGA